MFNKENALRQCKSLLKEDGIDKDEILNFLIDDCVARVNGYCRRKELPEGLYTLIPIMAARAYAVNSYGGQSTNVKSWTQGDRSEAYEDSSVIRDDWINDFVSRLEPFRIRRGKVPSDVK